MKKLHNNFISCYQLLICVFILKDCFLMMYNTNLFLRKMVSEDEPYSSFRSVSLLPTHNEIIYKSKFLRPNIVSGPYESVEHYLSTHFHLLREDFLKPFRESVWEYLENKNYDNQAQESTVIIYQDVKFCGLKLGGNNVGMMISFSISNEVMNEDWEKSRRFMNGSLLCFSDDNFKTIFFSRVLSRNTEDFKSGEIVVTIPENYKISDLCTKEFMMVESNIYFEPYYHVMKVLQQIKYNEFPMERYIIQVQTNIRLSSYILNTFSPDKLISEYLNSCDSCLDDSQFKAYMAGLTKEFVLIQGPPGTGKTYLSLKIVKTLLKYSYAWNSEISNTPLLVVCYTNHALDQFLEGLLKSTDQIIRVGSGSKSNILQEFTLAHKRKDSGAIKEMKGYLNKILTMIKNYEKLIEILEQRQHILSLQSLNYIVPLQRWLFNFENDEIFLSWLSGNGNPRNPGSWKGMTAYLETQSMYKSLIERKYSRKVPYFEFKAEECNINHSIFFIAGINTLAEVIREKKKSLLLMLAKNIEQGNAIHSHIQTITVHISELEKLLDLYKCYINKTLSCANFNNQILDTIDLWGLSCEERWLTYFQWTDMLISNIRNNIQILHKNLKMGSSEWERIQMMRDIKIMKNELVVGMTTTGASKFQPYLEMLQSKIVIVEEAAEVLESHIVASLTKHCQQLILVGDHQQLRPITADISLAQKYHLDISLFERMINNKVQCNTLKVQHRMRPEIAKLITPAIYPDLINHESVYSFGDILGVEKNVFFITHSILETQCPDSTSKQNVHEAEFMIAFCKHLLMQGYTTDNISILTTYRGQVSLLNEVKNRTMVDDVKITTVDNFQGEENDIILLSLVRSNKKESIGFLKAENRVCVALSRARKGLYIIGNMNSLTKNSKIWPLIHKELERQKAIGKKLRLRCQVHPEVQCFIENADDFLRYAPMGGCLLPCLTKFPCGHVCEKRCHVSDIKLKGHRCEKPASRSPLSIMLEHPCRTQCWESCRVCEFLEYVYAFWNILKNIYMKIRGYFKHDKIQ